VPVRGVVFDVGNVVVRWDPRTLYSKILTDPAECDWFLETVCTMAWHMRHDEGVPFAENRAQLIARYPQYEAAIVAWDERWWEMFSGTIPETVSAIEALHARGVVVTGLTNMPTAKRDGTLAMSPVFGMMSDIVVSADVGMMKPDARIYALSAERAGLAPEQLLFVDDSAVNVAAAAACGFDTHHFTDPAALWPALQRRGLL
jgi:2-haloacid dehalogenase/putative hydrolase of the HAD superfamily